jgi:type I restriction enzyme S subunit
MGEVADIVGGGTPSTSDDSNFAENGIPWLTPADLTGYREARITRGRRDLSEQGYRNSAARIMPAGTVLFSSRAPIGYCSIAASEISTNQGFKSFALKGEVSPDYVRHYLLSSIEYIEGKASGTTFKELSGGRAAELAFPLAPLPEQRRIVAKIDNLTGKSSRARDHLDHIPRLVEKYKQAVLAAAFRGDLTREWRVKHKVHWKDACALKELCLSITDGDHQAPPKAESGVPFITISAMNDGRISLAKATRFVPEAYLNSLNPSRRASKGDVLYSVTGSFGISGLVDFDDPFVFQRHIAILKPDPDKADAAFLFRMLASPQVMEQAEGVATGTAQRTVPLGGLRSFSVPEPSLPEQREIVRVLEVAFAWIDRLASEAGSARKLIDRLDQAVLAKAFRGELVPQDPADEPASALLERINAERGEAPKPKRRSKA